VHIIFITNVVSDSSGRTTLVDDTIIPGWSLEFIAALRRPASFYRSRKTLLRKQCDTVAGPILDYSIILYD